jgi:hypothetical protein
MVLINYPRVDLDTHTGLAAWRAKVRFEEGDWKALKPFLAEQPRFLAGKHRIPKCWYTELPQGDNYALDVEHFRPKASAAPLNLNHVKEIENLTGVKFYQNTTNTPYPWLAFDYRNYRLTSALPNRAGAKHIYFPVALGSSRLVSPQVPWITTEYNLLLDPVDPHDAEQLIVLPSGIIEPKAPKIALTKQEFDNYAANWYGDGFNYLRASVSIILYRLNEKILIEGRKEKYEEMMEDIDVLLDIMSVASETWTNNYIGRIFKLLLPSAPFSLAARSALDAYVPAASEGDIRKSQFKIIRDTILTALANEVAAKTVDWNRP